MSATVLPPARSTYIPVTGRSISAGGILRSEWIKLRSLRSTIWSFAIMFVIQIGFGVIVALNSRVPNGAPVTPAMVTENAVSASTIGIFFAQLVVAVLGVLLISGEYSTGQIRSSLTAVPKRLPVLWGKAVVFAVTTFVVAAISIVVTYFVTMPILSDAIGEANPGDPKLWLRLLGGAGYLVLIGLISLGLGAIIRSTAGGIAASLGLLLVLPTLIQFIPADWAKGLSDWLPGSAGQNLFFTGGVFEPWQALLVMLGWIAVIFTGAALLLRRRDA
jgi:ABC-2 type transport system permease protein